MNLKTSVEHNRHERFNMLEVGKKAPTSTQSVSGSSSLVYFSAKVTLSLAAVVLAITVRTVATSMTVVLRHLGKRGFGAAHVEHRSFFLVFLALLAHLSLSPMPLLFELVHTL